MVIAIVFGTETGISEDIAYETQKVLAARGVEADVLDFNDVKTVHDLYSKYFVCLFIVSTHTGGVGPSSTKSFMKSLEWLKTSGLVYLSLRYAVLALGDRAYKKSNEYCKFGYDLDNALCDAGMIRRHDVIDVDSYDPISIDNWLEVVKGALLW